MLMLLSRQNQGVIVTDFGHTYNETMITVSFSAMADGTEEDYRMLDVLEQGASSRYSSSGHQHRSITKCPLRNQKNSGSNY